MALSLEDRSIGDAVELLNVNYVEGMAGVVTGVLYD